MILLIVKTFIIYSIIETIGIYYLLEIIDIQHINFQVVIKAVSHVIYKEITIKMVSIYVFFIRKYKGEN